MAYATSTDVQTALGDARYLRLVDRDRSGVADASEVAAVDSACADASSVADSYIRRYLPLSTIPEALRKAVVDIAIFSLSASPTAKEQKAYNDSLQWLRDIGKGNAELDIILDAAVDPFVVEAPDARFAFEGPLP